MHYGPLHPASKYNLILRSDFSCHNDEDHACLEIHEIFLVATYHTNHMPGMSLGLGGLCFAQLLCPATDWLLILLVTNLGSPNYHSLRAITRASKRTAERGCETKLAVVP